MAKPTPKTLGGGAASKAAGLLKGRAAQLQKLEESYGLGSAPKKAKPKSKIDLSKKTRGKY